MSYKVASRWTDGDAGHFEPIIYPHICTHAQYGYLLSFKQMVDLLKELGVRLNGTIVYMGISTDAFNK